MTGQAKRTRVAAGEEANKLDRARLGGNARNHAVTAPQSRSDGPRRTQDETQQ